MDEKQARQKELLLEPTPSPPSLHFVLFEVWIDYLLDVLVVFHDHELIESVTHAQARHVVLEWRRVESSSCSADSKEQEACETDYVEVARLVSLELVVEVLEVVLGNAAAVV